MTQERVIEFETCHEREEMNIFSQKEAERLVTALGTAATEIGASGTFVSSVEL